MSHGTRRNGKALRCSLCGAMAPKDPDKPTKHQAQCPVQAVASQPLRKGREFVCIKPFTALAYWVEATEAPPPARTDPALRVTAIDHERKTITFGEDSKA